MAGSIRNPQQRSGGVEGRDRFAFKALGANHQGVRGQCVCMCVNREGRVKQREAVRGREGGSEREAGAVCC